MATKGFDWDYYYPDDGVRFSFEDMEKFGYKAYWISLRLRTERQKIIFRYIYENPDCVVGDMREALDLNKDAIMPVLRGLGERDLILKEEVHPKRYRVNQQLIDEILEGYKQRIFIRHPDVKERYEKRQLLEKAKDEINAIREVIQEEQEKARQEKEKGSDDKPSKD